MSAGGRRPRPGGGGGAAGRAGGGGGDVGGGCRRGAHAGWKSSGAGRSPPPRPRTTVTDRLTGPARLRRLPLHKPLLVERVQETVLLQHLEGGVEGVLQFLVAFAHNNPQFLARELLADHLQLAR